MAAVALGKNLDDAPPDLARARIEGRRLQYGSVHMLCQRSQYGKRSFSSLIRSSIAAAAAS
jgi:hypothetical protein